MSDLTDAEKRQREAEKAGKVCSGCKGTGWIGTPGALFSAKHTPCGGTGQSR